MDQRVLDGAKSKMGEVLDKFEAEIRNVRAGRATPSLVEEVVVSYYGTPTPLKEIAAISSPDPNLLVISPWDKSVLSDIEGAIQSSDLGITPTNDGSVLRISIPPLTEERRKELVKKVKEVAEGARVAMRNIRREIWDRVQTMERDGKITEDDRYLSEEVLNKTIAELNTKIEQTIEEKEKEILTV
jgi:ribosome recycling factor